MNYSFDVLIIGSGSAGLMTALELPESLSIAIITKKQASEGSSLYAQGGMSVAFSADIEAHIADTISASHGLADEEAVRFLVEHSKAALQKLTQYGVCWSTYKGEYHLVKEGGHSIARIAHSKDHTGRSIQEALLHRVQDSAHITILENHLAVELLIADTTECGGAYVMDASGVVHTVLAHHTIIASGGASKVYKYTTNPDTSTGDGIAMAYRAGCTISNMEFSQFHPTCLYHPYAKSFLISESLRGDGAKLVLSDGSEFMHKYDERGELAPRDIVARAIDNELKVGGYNCVYLDISHLASAGIIKHFPSIYHKCLEFNIDITRERIPVVPAAHYSCGGITTDLSGQTSIPNLYAVGEAAHTGVHGANRLASNSLLECIVFASACAQHISKQEAQYLAFPAWDASKVVESQEKVIISHLWQEVRTIMWNFVGIVRSNSRLKYAQKRLEQIKIEVENYYAHYVITPDLIELRNLTTCAFIIVESALLRRESRGLHYTTDYTETRDDIRNTHITR